MCIDITKVRTIVKSFWNPTSRSKIFLTRVGLGTAVLATLLATKVDANGVELAASVKGNDEGPTVGDNTLVEGFAGALATTFSGQLSKLMLPN